MLTTDWALFLASLEDYEFNPVVSLIKQQGLLAFMFSKEDQPQEIVALFPNTSKYLTKIISRQKSMNFILDQTVEHRSLAISFEESSQINAHWACTRNEETADEFLAEFYRRNLMDDEVSSELSCRKVFSLKSP